MFFLSSSSSSLLCLYASFFTKWGIFFPSNSTNQLTDYVLVKCTSRQKGGQVNHSGLLSNLCLAPSSCACVFCGVCDFYGGNVCDDKIHVCQRKIFHDDGGDLILIFHHK